MIDLWDCLGLVGFALFVGGISLWSAPAACVVAGVCLLSLYTLREWRRVPQSPDRGP